MNPLRNIQALGITPQPMPQSTPQIASPAPALDFTPPPQPARYAVPSQYAGAVQQAATHTGLPVDTVVRHLTAENGGNWDPNLRGRKDPTDFGVSQLNPIGVAAVTGTGYKGARNYFQDNYGRPFNPTSGTDQILASGVYLNRLRQFDLPQAGIKNPSNKDVLLSYNLGAQNYAQSLKPNADPAIVARRKGYEALLKSHGIDLNK